MSSCIVNRSTGAFKSTLALRGEVAEMTITPPKQKPADDRTGTKARRSEVKHLDRRKQEDTKEMRANEEEVKRARMGVANGRLLSNS